MWFCPTFYSRDMKVPFSVISAVYFRTLNATSNLIYLLTMPSVFPQKYLPPAQTRVKILDIFHIFFFLEGVKLCRVQLTNLCDSPHYTLTSTEHAKTPLASLLETPVCPVQTVTSLDSTSNCSQNYLGNKKQNFQNLRFFCGPSFFYL